MLNQDTKRKIDSARQILVGKVPDPKAQVEQITTALIYKFMDDTDKEAQVLGGKARYFTNGYEKYAWSKIMDVRLGGHDRLNLYFEAVSNLGKNKHIPQIFRDIFGDRALPPYRDAQTLTLFLKEINGFDFEHSEDLGDAYEYLLNVIGTSGEAGQFRTPRHLIDFIAEAVDPKKNETILDPACGTAGFLISAYKYILRQHDGKDDPEHKEKPLTPDEKKKLMTNFVGYDIDPGMARIATVNMYLHNFPEPKIFEYDTLTYEDRWDETFDVILANPPFMTPKGGIRPHKRFSIQANRAEVLFVDYIADHLNINGKAGVVVPEGIIFNNQTAYKNLRKKLVEDYLIAVVSLPQGVFIKPGGKGNVKTSVLIFDKALAKKTKDILFVKISNDGFDLGAQRRPIDKDDLPVATSIIKKFKSALKDGKSFVLSEAESEIARLASKNAIAETGDYNLTGERYKEVTEIKNQKWEMVELKEVATIDWGNTNLTKSSYTENGEYLGVSATGLDGRMDHFEHEVGVTVLSAIGANCGKIFYPTEKFTAIKNTITFTPDKTKINPKYLFYVMKDNTLSRRGAGQPFMAKGDVEKYKIPLPPLSVQQEIVEQIEVKQNAINSAREVIQNLERERRYFGASLRKLEDVEWVELGEVCEFVRGPFGGSLKKEIFVKNGFAVFEQQHAIYGDFTNFRYFVTPDKFNEMQRFEVESNDLIMSCSGTIGKTAIVPQNAPKGIINQAILKLRANGKLDVKYLKYWMDSDNFQQSISENIGGAAIQNVASVKILSVIKIPLPSLETQKKLVAKAEREQEIINANKQLIELMEQKIADILSEM